MRRQSLAVVALALIAVVVTAAAAFGARGGSRADRKISISGDVVVASGETVHGPVATLDGSVRVAGTVTDYVVVGDGELAVSGRVSEGVVVVHGDARISGRVGGDVVALSGRVIVSAGGSVGGDVVSRLQPRVAPGTVDGAVKRVDLEGIFTGLIIGFLAFLWLATTISIAVLGLLFVGLFPRAADTSAAAGRRVAASFGWGALVGIAGPLAALLVLVTIIGIPLGLGLLGALNVLAPLGYVTTALIIGRLWVKGPTTGARIGAFFAGFGILRLVALIPGLGFLVWFVACVYGIGAVSMAAWYGGRRPPGADGRRVLDDPPPAEPPVDNPPAAEPAIDAPTTDAPTADARVPEPPPASTADAPIDYRPPTETATTEPLDTPS
jgi:hypothetical protein